MPPELLHYRALGGVTGGPWRGVKAIARTGVLLLARRKFFWILYAFSLMIFLFYFFGQYLWVFLASHVQDALIRTGGVFGRLISPEALIKSLRDTMHLDGSAETFGDFIWTEGYIAVVILAFAGSVLVGNDFQHNSLPFYLSKPISRRHYIFGKCLAIAMLINCLTTIPAIGLFVEYGFIETWDYYYDNFGLFLGILAYGGAITISMSLLLLTTATWLRRTVPLVMVWTAIFVMARLVQRWLVDGIGLSPRWRLIDFWNDLYLFGMWCFGKDHRWLRPTNQEQPEYWEAAAAIVTVCLLCLLYLRRRVRAVEIIS
ncbi:ABC transporter permease subunit [Zavarzinella formosa]|uniref:ABC transporter permease subunit n=1 Tax=Zavarzinella formosa TaxID=360055 RepID=UPI0002E5A694